MVIVFGVDSFVSATAVELSSLNPLDDTDDVVTVEVFRSEFGIKQVSYTAWNLPHRLVFESSFERKKGRTYSLS